MIITHSEAAAFSIIEMVICTKVKHFIFALNAVCVTQKVWKLR